MSTGAAVAVGDTTKDKVSVFDLSQYGLQFTTADGRYVDISFTDTTGAAVLTLKMDLSSRSYSMAGRGNANCQATTTNFLVWPPETAKTWTLWKSDVSLVLECNGQVVVVYRIVDNGTCETNFATPIVGVKVNAGDSATTSFATVSKSA